MITNACRNCENWDEKDMLYTIGYVNESSLKSLWLVYGDCFCADKETYERIKNTISSGVNMSFDAWLTSIQESYKSLEKIKLFIFRSKK